MSPITVATDISFFELDRLFTESARAQRRKQRRKRRRERKNVEAAGGQIVKKSLSRSRSPPRRLARLQKIAGLAGFTGSVDKIEKTVVAINIPTIADERILFQHFSKCGTVLDVRVVYNRLNVATGIAIVEFVEDDAVNRACLLTSPHNEVLGSAITVKRADAQLQKGSTGPKRMMTRSQFTQQVLSGLKAPPSDTSGPNMRKLHIKNLRPVVTEVDMRGIFKPFGELEAFAMGNQECWITFQSHSDAQDAMGSMQGFQLVGQELQITVQAVEVPQPQLSLPAPPPPERMDLKSDIDFGGTGNLDNAGRLDLMKKLMSSHQQQGVPTVAGRSLAAPPGTPAPPPPPPTPSGSNAAMPPVPKPGGPLSRTLYLQNMFAPATVNLQREPRFYEDLREETHEECAKYGKVLHVTVDPRGASGLIYVLFDTPQQRKAAEAAMNGRWFEGKKIAAAGVDDSIWEALAAQAQGKTA